MGQSRAQPLSSDQATSFLLEDNGTLTFNLLAMNITSKEPDELTVKQNQLSEIIWQYRKWLLIKWASRLGLLGDAVGTFFIAKYINDNIRHTSSKIVGAECVALALVSPTLAYGLAKLSFFAKGKARLADENLQKLEEEITKLKSMEM